MARPSAFLRLVLLGSLMMPASALAQFPPPAGSAGAGNSAINGIPYGPANPSVVGDPSGIGNASRIPPPALYPPPPPSTSGSANASPSPSRVVEPPYAGASQRITIPRQAKSRRTPIRPRGRGET